MVEARHGCDGGSSTMGAVPVPRISQARKLCVVPGPFEQDWAEHLVEDPLELLAKYAVDDEIDRRVDGDQKIRNVIECHHMDAHNFQDVDYKCKDVAEKEHNHNSHQHRSQTNLFLL